MDKPLTALDVARRYARGGRVGYDEGGSVPEAPPVTTADILQQMPQPSWHDKYIKPWGSAALAKSEPNWFGKNVLANIPESAAMAANFLSPAARVPIPRVANPIKAYHGSPHDFNEFSLSKIGTGEGAQAYGHGLYFAENEGVARSYRDTLGPGRTGYWTGASEAPHINGKLIENQSDVAAANWLKVMGDKNYAHAINAAERSALENYSSPERAAGDRAIADRLREWRDMGTVVDWGKPGRMYEVALHARPEQFLDWDKPIAGQAPQTRTILDRLGVEQAPHLSESYLSVVHSLAPKMGVGKVPFEQVKSGISAALAKEGIPGIKYLDQGSRGAGQGTSNYVVWDDRIIQIMRKYGLIPPIAGAALNSLGGAADPSP